MDTIMAKKCGCGKWFLNVPSNARVSRDPALGGVYWECTCGSTLFVPMRKLKANTEGAIQLRPLLFWALGVAILRIIGWHLAA
jgi:hypothetical protein